MRKNLRTAFLVFFIPLGGLFGTELTVPHLELINRGRMEDGNFGISSAMEADISLSGGYKYGITLGLGAEIPNLEKALSYGRLELPYASSSPVNETEYNALVDELNGRYNNQAVISIRSLEAVIRDVFGKPFDISFFIGANDKLGSGVEFEDHFGTVPVVTTLRGFFYYPDGLGAGYYRNPSLRFNGAIHQVKGTGMAFTTTFWENVIPTLYLYQDLSFSEPHVPGRSYIPGHYSGDFKVLINTETVKFEVFAGLTYVNEENPILRGGALAYFSSGPFSFLMQAGIPYWETGKRIDIDNCYFLMEPRLRFDKIGANLTFFYRPVYYMNKVILDEHGGTDGGMADINLKVFYGNLARSAFEAGLEGTTTLRIHNGEDFSLWVSPFLSVATSGLLWDFKVRINPLYYRDGGDLAEGFVGIRTSY
ncbi:hypothetical protein AGMMS50230_00970 [Spirochaetia bacterium]|nr:hypothetical protein AGMMS50230_00970 [Spirochaetia bacterium]